jgi:hypothetical protein
VAAAQFYFRDFVQCVCNSRTGVGFDCVFLFKLGCDYVIHILTICLLLFGVEYAGLGCLFVSGVAWTRAVRQEGCVTALLLRVILQSRGKLCGI